MVVANINHWSIFLPPSTVYGYATTLYHLLETLLRNAVPLLQHPDLLCRLHLHQDLNLDAISTHLLRQTDSDSYLCCYGCLRGDRYRSFLYFHLCVFTSFSFLERARKADCQMHQRERVS
jgi:hypothetical protein